MSTLQDDRESWPEYRRLVMSGLRDLKEEIEKLDKKLDAVRDDVIMLKVKAGFWGSVAGAVGSLLIQIAWKMFMKGDK